MKFAITVREIQEKTFIVEADSLSEAKNKMINAPFIDVYDSDEGERQVFASPVAYVGGFATPDQIEDCEHFK